MTQEQNSAKRIVEILDQGASALDTATVAKLDAARRQAVAAMDGSIRVANSELVHAGLGRFGSIHLPGRQAWLPMLIALVIMLLAVAILQKNSSWEPVEADALLLGSDLPPEAYVDKGFDAWLENSSQP